MKFSFIAAEKAWPVSLMCRVLGVSTSGFYAWRDRPEAEHEKEDRRLAVLCRAFFDESDQRYGSPRICHDLFEAGEHVGRNRVIRLMQREGLVARKRRRFVRTTDSAHTLPVAPNLLARH